MQVENCAGTGNFPNENGVDSDCRVRWLRTLSTTGICPQILWATLLITMLLVTQVLDLTRKWQGAENQASKAGV